MFKFVLKQAKKACIIFSDFSKENHDAGKVCQSEGHKTHRIL